MWSTCLCFFCPSTLEEKWDKITRACPPSLLLGRNDPGTHGCSSSSQVTFQNRTRRESIRDHSCLESDTLHFVRWAHTFCFCGLIYFLCVSFTNGTASKETLCSENIILIELLTAVITTVIIITMIIVSVMIIIIIVIIAYILVFHPRHKFYCFCAVTYNNRLQTKKKRFNASLMCCEPIWTASGQTYWVVMEVVRYPTCSPAFCFNNKTPAPGWTQTLAQEEQCTLGETLGGNVRRLKGGDTSPLSWHKMQALPCHTCGFKGSARTFSSSPFSFSALQDSWTEQQRLLVLIWLPVQRQVLETSTHFVFSAISVK